MGGPVPSEPSRDPPTVSEWRASLTHVLLLLCGAVAAAMAVTAGVTLRGGPGRALVQSVAVLTTLASVLEYRRPRLPARARSWLVVSVMFAASVTGLVAVGFLAGPAISCAATVVTAGLLLGRRALIGVLAAAAVSTALAAWAAVRGVVPLAGADDLAPHNGLAWARTMGVALALLGLIGLGIVRLVERLELAIAREREFAEQRTEAERRRAAAEQTALEAQRLEAVGRLAAGVAHDFNNSLLVVRMWAELLGSTKVGDDQRGEALAAIGEAVDDASALARQLLVLSRRDAPRPAALSLDAVIDGYQKTLARVLPSDIQLVTECNEPATVLADEVQLHQVLLNLALNARDAMPNGGRLTLRSKVVELEREQQLSHGTPAAGRWAVLEVEDQGHGMDEATRRRAFEAFFTTKESGKGTGLGLATVLAIADQSGGHLDLWSEPGRGTRVAVWLEEIGIGPREAGDVAQRLEGVSVLVAEDSPAGLAALCRTLEGAGCRVLRAKNGTEALALCQNAAQRIDVLCADAAVPGLPLATLFEAFTAQRPDTAILVCSGSVEADLAQRGIREGVYELLPKPLRPRDLLERLRAIISKRAG